MLTSYTWSKTTDNASAAFQTTAAAGSSLAFAQNVLNFNSGEHGLSGLDFPQSWTVSFVEEIPLFRRQPGFVGHVFGGWGISGTYLLTSGQPYTPLQIFLNTFSGGVANDTAFNTNIVGVFDFVRPFVGSNSAPADQVGIFAGDACGLFGVGCSESPTQLISFNAVNNGTGVVEVTNKQVRYIANTGIADSVFGSPFGNAARNASRDAHTSVGNFSIYKNIRFNDRAWLQWHMTMTNVFNHPNFATVDAIVEDAGLSGQGVGFGNPLLTNGGSRTILFGMKVIF